MSLSYKGLWILLLERDMKRTDLKPLANLNSYTIAKMGRNEPVSLEAIEKICAALHCRIEDIVEYIPDEAPDDASEA